MKTITYFTEPLSSRLELLTHKAAKLWNKALRAAVLVPGHEFNGRIRVEFGDVDRRHNDQRVAQFSGIRGCGVITLADDVKWSITFWQRFLGLGDEDALAALLHEFGHALGLPHSDRYSDVMHPELGTTVISSDEAARYRVFLAKSHPHLVS